MQAILYKFYSAADMRPDTSTKNWQKGINGLRTKSRVYRMKRLSARKRAELRLIAQLTVDATLATEEKISRIAEKTRKSTITKT